MARKKSLNPIAIIWDYDGTLVDTRLKNLNVTRKIINKISGGDWKNSLVLKTIENYHTAHNKSTNWREFYKESFGLTEGEIDEAGRMWTGYQREDQTSIPLIDRVDEAVFLLQRFPQGIVSQNSREIIVQCLKENNLFSYFNSIIGYEEVDLSRQKPNPEGLIMCIETLTDLKPGVVIYIGDHETDVRCTINANKFLSENKKDVKIVSVGAFYGYNIDTSEWKQQPDYKAMKAEGIINIINKFEC